MEESPVDSTKSRTMQCAPAEGCGQVPPSADLIDDTGVTEDVDSDGVVLCFSGRTVERLVLLQDGDFGGWERGMLVGGRGEGLRGPAPTIMI